ncbi:MAG: hypothetical protein DRR19_23130 [Candidatus Parabeggiatoa sp. nov. 1]|nr:MAG: hypothetical protein DRR19_23130 [Gammaproteobacteria bacterium]
MDKTKTSALILCFCFLINALGCTSLSKTSTVLERDMRKKGYEDCITVGGRPKDCYEEWYG